MKNPKKKSVLQSYVEQAKALGVTLETTKGVHCDVDSLVRDDISRVIKRRVRERRKEMKTITVSHAMGRSGRREHGRSVHPAGARTSRREGKTNEKPKKEKREIQKHTETKGMVFKGKRKKQNQERAKT